MYSSLAFCACAAGELEDGDRSGNETVGYTFGSETVVMRAELEFFSN